MRTRRWAPWLLWLVPALWSSNYVIPRLAQGVVAPHALALGRWSLALMLMLPFVAPALWRQRAGLRREAGQLVVLGALGMWICGAIVYLGAHTTTATNIALIYSVAPVGIAVVGVKLLHERMSGSQRVAVALALSGVLFIIARGDPARLLSVRFTAGDGWLVLATASWIGYSVLLKRWPSTLEPAVRLAAIIGGSLVILVPGALIEAWATPAPALGARAGLLIGAAALLPGVLSYTAHAYLQRELGAARTALMLYLAPVYGAIGAWLVLGEQPGWHHAVGAALILPGIWLATRR